MNPRKRRRQRLLRTQRRWVASGCVSNFVELARVKTDLLPSYESGRVFFVRSVGGYYRFAGSLGHYYRDMW